MGKTIPQKVTMNKLIIKKVDLGTKKEKISLNFPNKFLSKILTNGDSFPNRINHSHREVAQSNSGCAGQSSDLCNRLPLAPFPPKQLMTFVSFSATLMARQVSPFCEVVCCQIKRRTLSVRCTSCLATACLSLWYTFDEK